MSLRASLAWVGALGAAWMAVAVQGGVATRLMVLGVKPDLALAAVIGTGLVFGSQRGAVWGGMVGVGLDLIGLSPFGIHALLMSLAGWLAGRSSGQLNKDHPLTPAIVTCGLGMAYAVGFFFLFALMAGSVVVTWWIAWIAVKAAVYTSLLAPAISWLIWRGRIRWGT